MNKIKKIFFFVAKKYCGIRLDVFVSSKVIGVSRSKVKLLILSGCVFVNHIKKKPSYIVTNGELIIVDTDSSTQIKKNVEVDKYYLKIIYEDSDIIIVNKNYDIIVHPSYGEKHKHLVNQILNVNPNLKNTFLNTNRPGIIHRLDKETSGILLITKKKLSFNNVLNQFKNRSIIKKYIAIVHKSPLKNSDLMKLPIGRHPINRKIMSVNSNKLRKSITYWRILERYKKIASLLEINIRTGRTHQIRVHCKKIGHAIIGDKIYNIKDKRYLTINIFDLKQMLHSNKIYFKHPITDKVIRIETIIPKRFTELIKKIEK